MTRGQDVRNTAAGGLAPWQVELTLRRLLNNPCGHFPVVDLARLCGLSRSYFTRAFKISTGTSPHRWLVRERIRRASELLERTDERISAIALGCGFSDQSHLTRMFHAAVGISPAAWRRQRRAGFVPPLAPPGR
ncbi:MAG TPA: AraC family transcriptional regulator [Allosphingosinicella sp.]|nr:AraC family transcriptional regulator [Allosphingosinicella sp.]